MRVWRVTVEARQTPHKQRKPLPNAGGDFFITEAMYV